MHYAELIENVSKYGYGVFTITMLSDRSNRVALTKFIQRNQNYFTEFRGEQGYLKLIQLTNEGKKYFGVNGSLSKSTTWPSLLDIALFNAYMAEKNEWKKQSNKPHFVLELSDENVGLISTRWGINWSIIKT